MQNASNTNPDTGDQLYRARSFFHAGDLANAEAVIRSILAKNSKDPKALGLYATVVYTRGDKKLSKKLWKQSLANAKQAEVFLTCLHDFLMALLKDGNREGAIKQGKQPLPDWPDEKKPNTEERDLLINLADILATIGQIDSSRLILENLTRSLPQDNKAKASFGLLLMAQDEHKSALELFTEIDQSIKPRDDISLLTRIYQCARMLNESDLVDSIKNRVVDLCPAYVASKQKGQTKNILIIQHDPTLKRSFLSKRDIFGYHNYPAQISELLANEFHFSFVLSRTNNFQQVKDIIPEPDLIINNQTNPEWLKYKGKYDVVENFIDRFNVPVINHPAIAVKTTRDNTIQLIRDIPGVIIPNTTAFNSKQNTTAELTDKIDNKFSYPLIVRTLFMQEGKGMRKVNDRSVLSETLSNIEGTFYVTSFIDCRDDSGFYRKIRAAVVGDDLHIVRVDYDVQWNVHGRKSEERSQFYLNNPSLLETERKICSDPDAELGPSVMQSLKEISRRIPLDIFGIDFDVTKDGEILFFEANATMNLLSTAHPSVPHPIDAEERLLSSLRRFINNTADSLAN